MKYGVTPSLTLDVTVKPDFAQAEADEQQVNLTQFSLFFPEKREFFLENSGMFYFGDIPRESRLGNARFAPPEEEMLLFFSRRIGLTDAGRQIPIAAGGRLTGRVGAHRRRPDDDSDRSRTAARDGDNYTVLRGRRDVLRNSDVGAIFLSRQSTGVVGDRNQVAGVDANFRFVKRAQHQRVSREVVHAGRRPAARCRARARSSGTTTSCTRSTRCSASATTFATTSGSSSGPGIRKHFVDFGDPVRGPSGGCASSGSASCTRTRATTSTPTSRTRRCRTPTTSRWRGSSRAAATSSSQWNPRFERIVAPFKVRPDQSFAPGSYGWNEYALELETEPQPEGVGVGADHHRRVLERARRSRSKVGVDLPAVVSPDVRHRAAAQRHHLPFPMHDFVTNLVTSRIGYAFNTRTFLDTLLQYNTDLKQFSANVRFDLIHRPLSDLFVVYNEQQLTDQPTPVNTGRGLIVKYTHMLAF